MLLAREANDAAGHSTLQINKLHLYKPLIRAIDSSNLKNDYSPAQKVTYKYYVGRKAMFDSDFKPGGAAELTHSHDALLFLMLPHVVWDSC